MKKIKKMKKMKKKSKEETSMPSELNSPDESFSPIDSSREEAEADSSSDESINKHKQALKNLEQIDPEFHEFLQKNDKGLLDFDSSLSDDEDNPEEEQCHEPPDSLEVASDASDYEDDSHDVEISGKVTMNMVDAWEKELNSNKRSLKPVRIVVRAFHACLLRISGDPSDKDVGGLRVDGSAIFNAVVRLCVTSLYPYLRKLMNLPQTSVNKKHVEKSKKWPYAKTVLRSYLTDLIKLLSNVTSEDILRVLLKHLHQMIPFASCLPSISKPLLKHVITIWSANEDDTVKVVSFLCLLRYASSDVNLYLHSVLKKMYISYVANSKFVSVNSLPAINFLRKSLAEMFSLNENIAYNHAFLYIRQLAIYLRAAVTLKKKDSIQTVYNWQFISSLRLWVDVLCSMREKQQMNSLIYPTIQIIIGCIKLVPTAQYFPLRFHCVQMLIKLSKELEVFIPVLPFLIEGLSILNASTKHKKLSMKPMDFTYILRLSKSQLQENSFKDAVIDNVYDCLLQYTSNESYRISFPDTVVLLLIQMKQFLKECKNANYAKKLKLLLEKIEEVSKMINEERSKCGIALSDATGIAAWESNMKLKSNSLMTFYESWSKIQEQKVKRKIVDEVQFNEYELPVLKKLPGKKTKEVLKKKGDRVVLFDSDIDDDDGSVDFNIPEESEEKVKKGSKQSAKKSKKLKRKKEVESDGDEAETNTIAKKKKKKSKTGDEVNSRAVKEKNRRSSKLEPSSIEEQDDVVMDFKLDDFLPRSKAKK